VHGACGGSSISSWSRRALRCQHAGAIGSLRSHDARMANIIPAGKHRHVTAL
jgi:hypothetical protein